MSVGLQGIVHAEGLMGPTGLAEIARLYETKSLVEAIRRQADRLATPAGPFVFGASITTGGLAALGGNVEVTVLPDQSVRWKGHLEDSGLDGYNFFITALLPNGKGQAVALAKSGHVGGALTSGDSEFSWDETAPPSSGIGAVADYGNAQLQTHLEYDSDIGSALESVLSWVVKFAVGAAVGPVGGAVVFVGFEIGSLISSGSLVPGARMVEGILWMAGPANTLFAIIGEGIAQLGSRERPLHQDEYDCAYQVFGGTLPPLDKIRLTDTIGAGDAAFVFPRYDGKITLNMGPTAFADPRAYKGEARNANGTQGSYGRTFIHEMTHACQLHHGTNLDYLARGLAARGCDLVGDAYLYGPAGPDWLDAYGLEQQAQIVGDWYSALHKPDNTGQNHTEVPQDTNSPYFRYIQDYVRTGRY